MNEHAQLCHALQCIFRTSLGSLHRLIRILKTPEAVWKSSEKIIEQILRTPKSAATFIVARRTFDINDTWNTLQKILALCDGFVLTQRDPEYPELLREIAQPPLLLYGRGNKNLLNHTLCIAIVGSRGATAYGKSIMQKIIHDCLQHDMTIVSGLAFGIDRTAHEETLQQNGNAIVVLGSSLLDQELYPQSHVSLARRIIAANGLLLSEYPPGTRARPYFFPERNRIIAGLSHGVIVVEAREHSGSLITARFALDANRDVYAVPGNITSKQSRGTNQLLADGATPWLSCASLLNGIKCDHTLKSQNNDVALSPEEQQLYDLIAKGIVTTDDIIAQSGTDCAVTLSILSTLELRGLIAKEDGMRYQICTSVTP